MGLRKILTDKDPALHKVCRPVTEFDSKLHKLLDDMRETLIDSGGVGLAAPQVGILRRVAVIDVGDGLFKMVNPVIVETEGEQRGPEGCLSVPGRSGYVVRPNVVTVQYQDENGEPLPVYSIASGLDYPGVGPEHAYLRDLGRVHYETATDEEAMEAFFLLCRYEGIIPAIESSHALAYAIKYAKEKQTGSILVCLSGRGDKDIDYVYEKYGCGERFIEKYEK